MTTPPPLAEEEVDGVSSQIGGADDAELSEKKEGAGSMGPYVIGAVQGTDWAGKPFTRSIQADEALPDVACSSSSEPPNKRSLPVPRISADELCAPGEKEEVARSGAGGAGDRASSDGDGAGLF